MESFDIAVIGAGPGGNFAALTAAGKGASVVVFEEHEKAGEPVHCGECLSRLACGRLGLELPDEAISTHARGIRLVFPNGRKCVANEDGYTLEKDKLEQHLASLAQAAGAKYRMRHRVSGMAMEGGTWKITTTKGEFASKIIIDASGVGGFASKTLGLNPVPATIAGLQHEIIGIESDSYIDFHISPELAPHGYLWVIPKKGGRANVGLVTTHIALIRQSLGKFVSALGLSRNKITKTFGGSIPISGPLPKTYSNGLLLIGDAAGFTSPMFEGGTSLAMASGKFAGETAAGAVESGDSSAVFLSEYQSKWQSEFPQYHKIIKGKEKFYQFTVDDLNSMAEMIPSDLTSLSPIDKAKVGAKVMASNPALFAKGFTEAMEALGKSRAKYYGW